MSPSPQRRDCRIGVVTPDPEALSEELRRSQRPHLGNRRKVIGLTFVAAGAMQVVALYQAGLLRRVPEPDLPLLDADRIDASGEAYRWLSVGDGFLGLLSYATTAALAAGGPADRYRDAPWLPLALAAKATLDAGQAARLSWQQWSEHRGFCSWCLLSAGATFAALPLTFREAVAAVRSLRPAQR